MKRNHTLQRSYSVSAVSSTGGPDSIEFKLVDHTFIKNSSILPETGNAHTILPDNIPPMEQDRFDRRAITQSFRR